MRKILSLILAAVMVLSMIPAVSFAAEPITVYLDPVNGNNTFTGAEDAPVKDFAGAYALLANGGGTVVLLGDVTFTAETTLPACDYPVTITSKTGAEGIKSNSHIKIAGETTFENMTFTLTKQSTGTCISGNGYKLTMGEGITSVPYGDGYHFCLIGGDYSGTVASTDLTIMSGQYRYVYAGGYIGDVTGNAKLTMTGGVAANLAVTRTGKISGNVEMNFSGTATVTTSLYCGAATSGDVGGAVTVTLGQGANFKYLYTGSNGSGDITGMTTVIWDGYESNFTNLKGKGGSSCTGSIGGSRLVLKSGVVNKAPTDFGTVDIDIPQDKILTLGCSLSADTLTGNGTLAFSGAAALTVSTVKGSVTATTHGDTLSNHVYITAPAGSAITFPADTGITEQSGQWYCRELGQFQGLVLKTPSTVKMNLYTGIWNRGSESSYTLVEPYATETKDGYTWKYYPNAQGSYHVRASQSGYITLYKDIYQSPEEAATKTVETITLDKKSDNGFAPSTVYSHTTEVLENEAAWKSDASMYPKYAPYLQNPIFQEGRNPQQMTTQEEMEDFIASLDQKNDNMYIFSLGQSDQYGYNIPAVIFTESDLSSATTLEEAAALLDNSRLNVFYRAQIHGNEPAGGEGALAMIYYLQQGYGEELLDKINLVIIPRLSPDGSYLYQRALYHSSHTCDHLLLETREVRALQKAYLAFQPEILLDGHERVWNNQSGDIQVSTSFTPMNSDAWQDTALAMDQAAFTELEANNLCGYYYSTAVNGYNPNMANAYFTTAGTLYVLMETRGIYGGNEAIERRVVAHMAAVEGILSYLHDNATQVKAVVTAERNMFAENGATYDAEDQILLETGSRTTTAADLDNWGNLNTRRQTIDWATGEVTFSTRYPSVYDVVKRSRTAPTAYVIPADANNIHEILTQLTIHGIPYTKLPQGATLHLQRYGGTTTEATLSAEALTRFPSGCYVFTMNHEKALVLATLMEPDITNAQEHNGTLAQRGLLTVSDTYRYIRDLNAEGFVDYTVTDAELISVTVYLDGENGLDTNPGAENAPVKTLEKAYALMDAALSGAAEGSQGYLVIIGMYDLGARQSMLPAADYMVNITGKTAADGFKYTGGSTQATRTFEIQGPTTFRNITIHINNSQNFNFFLANGHKLVVDEGVNFTTNKANCYFTLAGGDYDYTDSTASTDITIRSGKWRTIYAGGYRASVTGKAKADISGVWVYNNIAVTYCGNIGEAEMIISDAELVTNNPSFIYAGSIEYSDSKDVGAILGDSTVILGENISGLGAYTSSCLDGNINGTATIIAAGVDLSQFPVYAVRPGTTGTTNSAVLKLGADVTQDVTLDAALPLDLAGCDITGALTVDGSLTVYDSATDDYTVADGKCGEITGNVTGTLVAKEGYIAAANGFHKFGDQYISGVSLRPNNAGIYYTATFLCDEVLADALQMGVAVSLVDMPGADFMTDEDTLYTTGTTGVMIQNILTGDAEDADRAIMDIYAASYVVLPDGTVLTSENEVAYSLYDILLILKDQNPSAFKDFCTTWNISTWF